MDYTGHVFADKQWAAWIEAVYSIFHAENGWNETIPASNYDWKAAFEHGENPRKALAQAGLIAA